MPPLPYIFCGDDGRWVVQWYGVGPRPRRVFRPSFPEACRMAATVRRWQLNGRLA